MWKRALPVPKVWAQLLTQNPALSPLSRHLFTPLTTSQLSRRETGDVLQIPMLERGGTPYQLWPGPDWVLGMDKAQIVFTELRGVVGKTELMSR